MKTPGTPNAVPSAATQGDYTAQDLFPALLPAGTAPILPRPGTVKDSALAAIIRGKVTQADFRRSWRLAAYIDEIADNGWAVCSEWVTLPGWRDPIKLYQDGIGLFDVMASIAIGAWLGLEASWFAEVLQ